MFRFTASDLNVVFGVCIHLSLCLLVCFSVCYIFCLAHLFR